MKRGQAYAWLAAAMGRDEVHIGQMTIEECELVVELSRAHFDELLHPSPPF